MVVGSGEGAGGHKGLPVAGCTWTHKANGSECPDDCDAYLTDTVSVSVSHAVSVSLAVSVSRQCVSKLTRIWLFGKGNMGDKRGKTINENGKTATNCKLSMWRKKSDGKMRSKFYQLCAKSDGNKLPLPYPPSPGVTALGKSIYYENIYLGFSLFPIFIHWISCEFRNRMEF